MFDDEDDDDDWCEHCGSEDCKGECRKVPVNELPGARLERIVKEQRDRAHQETHALLAERLYPETKTNDRTLEDFERELEGRAKVVVARRRDGSVYRKRV
jgi:hypothetical protein